MQGCLQNWSRGISNCAARCLPRGVATVALGILGVLGAMLSLTDIFGMTAYSVSKRQREFGIHMALRAHRIQVLQMRWDAQAGSCASVLQQVYYSACWPAKSYRFIVYQASARDPLVLASVVLGMSLVILIATWITPGGPSLFNC